MKLMLSQQELEQAIRRYVTGMISLHPGADITIEFTAGRGEKGITAEVDINYLEAVALPPSTPYPGPLTGTGTAKETTPETEKRIPNNPAPITAAQARANADAFNAKQKDAQADAEPDAKDGAKEETPPTRKTAGKTLFGDKGPAANDDGKSPENILEETATEAAGGRKTLFNN